MRASLVLLGFVLVGLVAPAHATVVCQKRNGVLAVRESCRSKEHVVDLSTISMPQPSPPQPPFVLVVRPAPPGLAFGPGVDNNTLIHDVTPGTYLVTLSMRVFGPGVLECAIGPYGGPYFARGRQLVGTGSEPYDTFTLSGVAHTTTEIQLAATCGSVYGNLILADDDEAVLTIMPITTP